jgi:hypothetical protein
MLYAPLVKRATHAYFLGIALCVVAAYPCASQAATPAQTIHEMVGNWSCVTSDANHKTWHVVAKYAMFGPWLRMNAEYPAQNGQRSGSIVKYFGYDSDQGRWIVTSVDTSGEFYVIDSKSKTFDGSQWEDTYPADTGTAAVKVQNADEYTFDARIPIGGGHDYRSHTICRRI